MLFHVDFNNNNNDELSVENCSELSAIDKSTYSQLIRISELREKKSIR
jgi:hypothetical protein